MNCDSSPLAAASVRTAVVVLGVSVACWRQVKELVAKGCKITKLSSRSEREVAGYVEALRYINDYFENLTISEKTIREIHQILAGKLTEDQFPSRQRGAYKDITNDVVEIDNAMKTGLISS